MAETDIIAALFVKAAKAPGERRRREILTVLLKHPEGLTLVELLDKLRRRTARNEILVRRDLGRLAVDGHAVVSNEGQWYTSRQRAKQFQASTRGQS